MSTFKVINSTEGVIALEHTEAPASQQSITADYKGQKVEGVRWYEVRFDLFVYEMLIDGKLYRARSIGEGEIKLINA